MVDGVIHGVDATADVAPIIGCDSGDVGTLCTWEDINPWAWFKPMRWREFDSVTSQYSPCERPLLNAEFKGDHNDQSNGIYFGLQRVSPSNITAEVATWPYMHDVVYTYLQPRGLATYQEMYRLLDFASWETLGRGYNHHAVPNPSGEMWSNVGYYNGTLDGLTAGYFDTNVEGVDLSQIFLGPNEVLNNVLALTFPCILITDSNNHSYFTALDSEASGRSGPTPLYYNSAYHRGPWSVDFVKDLSWHGTSQGQPWTSAQRFMKATLFMLRVPSNSFIDNDGFPHLVPVASDPNDLENLAQWWFDCDDEMLVEITNPPVPFPNAINKSLSLFEYWVGVRITANSVAFSEPLQSLGNTKMTIDFTKQVDSTGGPYTYSAQVIVQYDGQHQVTKTFSGSSADSSVPSVDIYSQEFDGALWYVPGKDIEVTVQTTGSWSQGMNVTTRRFTVPSN